MVVCVFLLALLVATASADGHNDDKIAAKLGSNVEYRPDTCLEGGRHLNETKPEPETERHIACRQWKDAACCTPEFTQTLAHANVTNVDGFHWNRCGDFSPECQKFFVEIECFYRCSPNIAHFEVPYPSAFNNLPLCSDYCDQWYDACKDEMTCAVNWIFDWVYDADGRINYCPANNTCQSFSSVYGSGRGICETLWGDSFKYGNQTSSTSDSDRYCFLPYFPEDGPNPNEAAVRNLFPGNFTVDGAVPVGGLSSVTTMSILIMLLISVLMLLN